MKSHIRSMLALASVLVVAACAAQSAGGTASGARHNLVTAEQLARVKDQTLYDALRSIRPAFLRTRQPESTTMPEVPIAVYIGQLRMGEGIEHLREIRAANVQEVEFLEPHQANARFGGANSGGALIVVMKP